MRNDPVAHCYAREKKPEELVLHEFGRLRSDEVQREDLEGADCFLVVQLLKYVDGHVALTLGMGIRYHKLVGVGVGPDVLGRRPADVGVRLSVLVSEGLGLELVGVPHVGGTH